MKKTNYQYLISQDSTNEIYQVWAFDSDSPSLLENISGVTLKTIPKGSHLTQVGNYILQWSPLNSDNQYTFRLLEFNPSDPNPLGSFDPTGKWTEVAVQAGTWSKGKFFGSRSDFANPDGAKKGFESGTELFLISMHNFVLNWIPTDGRGTYQLFNFDHGSKDPLSNSVTPQGAWLTVEAGHQLIYICGYVLDWKPSTGEVAFWQFDAENLDPLGFPAIKKTNWSSLGISDKYQICVIGEYLLTWDTSNNNYRLWKMDLNSESGLSAPVQQGTLPSTITPTTIFTGIETLIPVDSSLSQTPGTLDFMRDKIEHVIYYMLENRSFDHICGWLYDQNAPIKVIGPAGPYRGVDSKFTNSYNGKEYSMTLYNDGKLTEKTKDGKPFVLDIDKQDPYHDNSDVLRQMFSKDINDYFNKKEPDMGGYAWNNGTSEVMYCYSPEQLPVINGLAKSFAISDDWFCSMPGGTDVNRAFALTGSSLGQLNNFQNGTQFTEWADQPHRPSIWKVLWSNGIEDFKIYNAVEWMECKFTYNLFLKGQIPSIDGPFVVGNFMPQLNQFYDDLKYGTLPKFAFLEPKWVASLGSTSYHPGNDLIPGERTLNDLFNAIQASPLRDKILLVITFDEHGGIADHVKPPYAVKPFAHESNRGFEFDLLGPRIPTILVSPWIKENTVFRAENNKGYESTSILATLLKWLGIPRSRWGLGERTNQAPTFEAVVQETNARQDKLNLQPPWDSSFPKGSDDPENANQISLELPIHDLHRLVVPRMVAEMTPNLSNAERAKIADEILSTAKTQAGLFKHLDNLSKKNNGGV
ncbi:MAG: alkaline phosphatase family protein [Bacteroidia bacterium]